MITADMIMQAQADIIAAWSEDGKRVIETCAQSDPLNISFDEFLNYCTACGGNWVGMFLTGLKELRPAVWDAIPEKMGRFAWQSVCSTLILCGVDTSEG